MSDLYDDDGFPITDAAPASGQIIFRFSNEAGARPDVSSIEEGEIFINLADRAIVTKRGGSIVALGGGSAQIDVVVVLPAPGERKGELVEFNGSLWYSTGTAWVDLGASGGGVSDGNKGDITVAGSSWNINAGAVSTAELGGDITTAGLALLGAADATAQRTALGLGTAATQPSTAFAIASHLHGIPDVGGLQTALDAKANTVHTHAIAGVTGLQTALDAKLDDSQATSVGLALLGAADATSAASAAGATRRANFAIGAASSVAAEGSALRAVANPTTGVGHGAGMRVRLAFNNDTSEANGFSDAIDVSTWSDATAGGINSLYLDKMVQRIRHKWAPAGGTSWTERQLAYTNEVGLLAGTQTWTAPQTFSSGIVYGGITQAVVQGGTTDGRFARWNQTAGRYEPFNLLESPNTWGVGQVFAAAGGSEGGEFGLQAPVTGTNLTGLVHVDVHGNNFRVFSSFNGQLRGFRYDFSSVVDGAINPVYHSGNQAPVQHGTVTGQIATWNQTIGRYEPASLPPAGGGGLPAYSVVSTGQTIDAGAPLLAVITTAQDFLLPAALVAGSQFILANARGSAAGALARVLPGAGRQIVGADIGTAVSVAPGETIHLVARSTTLLEIV